MKIIYECSHCGKQFDNHTCCAYHEVLHLKDAEKIKYYILHIMNKDICKCCVNSYWVYGSELSCMYGDCTHSNNYKDFVPYDAKDYMF